MVLAVVAGCGVLAFALYFATKLVLRTAWRHRRLPEPSAPTDAFGDPL
jgi:hypothetical protein